MSEIVFILEPDTGRVTVESSQAEALIAKELNKDLGQGSAVNCGRPKLEIQQDRNQQDWQNSAESIVPISKEEQIYLYRIYHYSTVDGPGRRSVIQVAGCSIRCIGCYIPETHRPDNGRLTSIGEIVAEIDQKSREHDGVTILGGEPFDQVENLSVLVQKLKSKGFHLTIYTGFTLDELIARNSGAVNRILDSTDLLIDGPFNLELTANAGEYRGSSNQRLIFYPILGRKNER